MAVRRVKSNRYEYQFCSDGLLRDGNRLWALVGARLIDELTDKPPTTAIQVKATNQGVWTRVAGDGLVGVIGNPERVFSPFNLQSDSYNLSVMLSAKDYVPVTQSAQIGPILGFPENITAADLPVHLGDIPLHREPTIIRGRVLSNGVSPQPVNGAEISISNIHRKVPPFNTTPTPAPYHPISLLNSLYIERPAGITKVQKISLMQTSDPEKKFTEFGSPGSQRIKLSNTLGLLDGDYLHIDTDDSARQEVIQIDSITRLGLDASPGRVNLLFPLGQSHRIDAKVSKVSPQLSGTANSLGVAAIQGDHGLLVDTVNNLDSHAWVEIKDGISPNEYHVIHLFRVTSDADGFYMLPPLSRVGQLKLQASSGPMFGTVEFIPDYNRRNNVIDVFIKQP